MKKEGNGDLDAKKVSGPTPERVIKAAFVLIMMKATNDLYEKQHGISPIKNAASALNALRKRIARAIMPNNNGNSSNSGSKSSANKRFKGKGKKLGKK